MNDVGIVALEPPAISSSLVMPDPDRLVEILSYVASCPNKLSSAAVPIALNMCFRLSVMDGQFWTKLSTNPGFGEALQCLLLTDARQGIRASAIATVQEHFNLMEHAISFYDLGNTINILIARYFWVLLENLMMEATNFPHQCEELFQLIHFILVKINKHAPDFIDIAKLATETSRLLLEHTTIEV